MNAINNQAAAQTEVAVTELGMTDTELDAVSGGVHPIVVLYSIISLGTACAVVSVVEAAQGGNCGERLGGPLPGRT